MASLLPKNLIGPSAAITSTPTVYASTANADTYGVIRSILCTATASVSLTVALGADAAGTRVLTAVALTTNVPYLLNAWLVTAVNSAHAIDATGTGTGTQELLNISGYQWD